MRVLLIAPYCDGTDIGEARSTHQWALRLAEHCELTVLTHTKYGRPSAAGQLPHTRVIEWHDAAVFARFERFNAMLKPGYARFYCRARSWLRRALADGERFDLVHQVAPLALRYPCPAVGLGLRLIIGPLAGSLATPPAFAREFLHEPWYVRLRTLDALRLRYDPWLRRSYSEADVIIGVAPYVRDLLRSIPIRRFEVASETGVLELPPLPAQRPKPAGEFRLLYVGRVVRAKGVRDAIRAMSCLRDLPGVTLDVVGDGNDRSACEAEAKRLGVGQRVRFHGRLERTRCDPFYAAADAFIFPSLREPSGNVVFEALSFGLPVVAGEHGGPGYIIDESCGICVSVTDPEQYAVVLADSVRRLVCDPPLRKRLSLGARQRVAELALWDNKIEWMRRLYATVQGNQGSFARATSCGDDAHGPRTTGALLPMNRVEVSR